MFSRRNAKKKSVQRNATARSESSTPNETFFPAVCDSFAFCLLFLRSLLAAILFFFCLPFAFPVVFSVGGRFATNTRIHAGNGEIHGSCNSFSLAVFFSSFSISFSPLNFRFLIFFSSLFFLFMCIYPPTRCWLMLQCRSKTDVLYFRYVRFSLLCFFFRVALVELFYAMKTFLRWIFIYVFFFFAFLRHDLFIFTRLLSLPWFLCFEHFSS